MARVKVIKGDIYAAWRDYDDYGNPIEKTSRTNEYGRPLTSHDEALEVATRREHALQTPLVPKRDTKMSLRGFSKEWLRQRETRLSPTSVAKYQRTLDGYILPVLGDIRLQALKARRIETFYTDLRQGTAAATVAKGPMSEGMLKGIDIILASVLNSAVKQDYLTDNPLHRVENRPRSAVYQAEWLDEDEVWLLIDSTRGTRHCAIFALAITTGMRRGELAALKWSHLRRDRKGAVTAVSVSESRSKVGTKGEQYVTKSTKTGESREIPVVAWVAEILDEHAALLDEYAARDWSKGGGWEENDLVFPGRYGRYANPHTLHQALQKATAVLGLPKMRFHDLRVTFSTHAVDKASGSIKDIQAITGHRDASTLMGVYAKAMGRKQKIMDEVWGGRTLPPRPGQRPNLRVVEEESNGLAVAAG